MCATLGITAEERECRCRSEVTNCRELKRWPAIDDCLFIETAVVVLFMPTAFNSTAAACQLLVQPEREDHRIDLQLTRTGVISGCTAPACTPSDALHSINQSLISRHCSSCGATPHLIKTGLPGRVRRCHTSTNHHHHL